jgi:aspartyl-tRNA(Asn)/glutamyl-tRNA(Gln) amidotransferase subunit B
MAAPYRPTIGLEIHAELSTRTKMFCECRNDPDESEPNVHVCPVCLAHPGALPVVNKEAVRQVLRVGKALKGTLAEYAEFDRKSYFYPDIPKGYQISQYEHPFVSGGTLRNVAITRVHLEEDTARSSHGKGSSKVDFNRAGVPLMELVTEPVIHDAKTAGEFARELQLLLRTLGASEANLEKGEMRVEANISVSKDDSFGTKVEVKNLNSFRSVERAIEFEIARQSALLEKGEKVSQETRGWDETKQETFHQRFKEGSADYRYFPEPDLPKLLRSDVLEFSDTALETSLPELPTARRERYSALGLKAEDVETLLQSKYLGTLFDTVEAQAKGDTELIRLSINYVASDIAGLLKIEEGQLTSDAFLELMRMTKEGDLSSRGAKDVLALLWKEGGSARRLAEEKGLLQVSDTGALEAMVLEVLKENPKAVDEYRAGKEASLQFLLGASMKATKGAGNPKVLREILVQELNKSS